MFNDSLLNILQASWKKWDNPSVSVKAVNPNEYIVFTDQTNDLNEGIYFYLKTNSDGTYSLSDRVLTVNSVNREIGDFNAIKHEAARIAAQYGILLNNQGEFFNEEVGQLNLSSAMYNFERMLYDVMDYAARNVR